ncbi:MAG TPA: hypothetical protein VNP94_14005 [Actinomycetota bacterium]|nr:hypothetical protein [Actinomycetota bacterium]
MGGRGPARFVEVAGVAGAGKTTLTGLLCADGHFRRGGFIHARTPSHLAHVVRSLPGLLPVVAGPSVRGLGPTWRELKLMVYASRWHRVLRRRAEPGTVTLLDQGPLYAVVRLRAEAALHGDPRFERWCDRVLDVWADELAAVVWLDADDGVLLDRIHRRRGSHEAKGLPVADVGRFVQRYRALFEAVFEAISSRGGPQVLRFDTGGPPATEVAAAVRAALVGGVPGGGHG